MLKTIYITCCSITIFANTYSITGRGRANNVSRGYLRALIVNALMKSLDPVVQATLPPEASSVTAKQQYIYIVVPTAVQYL